MYSAGTPARGLVRIGIVLLLFALYPVVFPGSMNVGFSLVLFAALATSWDLIGGWAGQLSLGHAAFVGFGAYASVLLWLRLGVPLWWGVPAAMAAGAVLAVAWGSLTFRLRGAYFSLSTIAIAEILRVVATNWVDLTGGPEGISVNELPTPFGLDLFDRRIQFALALALLAVALLASWRVSTSRFGHRLEAIREDQDSSMALGVNPARLKVFAFAASAALTVAGGALYALHLSFFEPHGVFDLHLSVQLVLMAIVGGMGSVLGPTLGAVLLLTLQELFRNAFQQASLFIYGVIIVLIVRYAPDGLSGWIGARWRRIRNGRRPVGELSQG